MAVACLHALAPSAFDVPLGLWQRVLPDELSAVRRMIECELNTPRTSSAGRLFDAVAALLDVRDEVTYEGQAAVELEQLAHRGEVGKGPLLRLALKEESPTLIIDPEPLLKTLVDALRDGARKEDLAVEFHFALAEVMARACARVRDGGGPSTVVLCGGVFQNRVLLRMTIRALKGADLIPVPPGLIPVNDGGLSLGQVLVANAMTAEEALEWEN